MSTTGHTLTPTQQIHVSHARRFLAEPHPVGKDSYTLGSALTHLELLLDIIDDITAGGAS